MQYTYINHLFKAKDNKGITSIIKIAVFFIAAIFLYTIIEDEVVPVSQKLLYFSSFSLPSVFLLIIPLLLLPLNWHLEALKWHQLNKNSNDSSMYSSYKGILSGITLGLFTPHGVGDVVGRISHLNGNNRLKSLGYILLSKVTQLHATVFFGGLACMYLLITDEYNTLIIGSGVIAITTINFLFILLLFSHKKVILSIRKNSVFKPFYKYLSLLLKLRNTEILNTLKYSFLRYFVFSIQFLLLLIYFEIPGSYLHLFMGIFFVFLIKSILPTMFELGVREAAAVFFFSGTEGIENILLASFVLWFINIVLPALIGLFFLLKMRVNSK